MYLVCDNPSDPSLFCNTINALEAYITDIQHWMHLNSLQLNNDKNKFLPIHSKFLKALPLVPIQIGDANIHPTPSARNLSIVFDNALILKPHICAVCK